MFAQGRKAPARRDLPKGVKEPPRPPQAQKAGPTLEPIVAFYICFAAHALAAIFSPIQDCDEVFQYWDPTHYLNHGYGLQSWEYSPEYAIRSWAYASIHAAIIFLARLTPFVTSKTAEFYSLRLVFAFVCAVCESRFFAILSRAMNPRIGMIFLLITTTSTGMFHASVAYLPSTFAMYTTLLGFTAFMDWKGGLRTAQGIMWFGIGGILGWPFASALVFPFVFEELLMAAMTKEGLDGFHRLLDGTVRSLIMLGVQFAVDVFFYRKIACVPWNIVYYNVFSGSGRGPDIFGTEPWYFYALNLTLNFNVWFLLALASLPLVFLQHFGRKQAVSRLSFLRAVIFTTPLYLWLGMFTLQPHKEERFMYPAYPAVVLNASIALHIILGFVGSPGQKSLVSFISPRIRFFAVTITALLVIDLSLLRTAGLVTGYTAPLHVYTPLRNENLAVPGDTVCLGKEWYRFPSSYHLPVGVKAKFIKSAFSGLLPGEFSQANTGFGFYPGAWLIPPGMNDENREDVGKYTDVAHCTFMIDSQFPDSSPSPLEPNYINDSSNWEVIKCSPFLDPARTGIVGRTLWVPDSPLIPDKFRRKWGEYFWTPSPFKRPSAPPYPDWSVEETKPLPYRPFRPKYFVTLGLRNMNWDEWIELDNRYPEYHARKAERIASRGERCCRTHPDAYDGAVELVEELCSYLPQRYPSLYKKTDVGMDNLWSGESFNIVERPLKEDPMQMAARMTQDDLAIMFEKPDGQYYLLAGAILLAGFWRLEDKYMMPLSEIHTSGDVPQYKEKLEKGMMNFFRRIKPEAPMLRNNYFVQVDDDLAWSQSIGSEDSEGFTWDTAEKDKAIQHHHFRSERQSLRRLPRSGGVVFTIRTYFHPMTEICREPYVPGRMASAVRSWADDVSKYRGRARFGDVLLEYLDKKHEEQLANGLEPDKEDEHHSYPY
ncbi:glycosyltransferase family 22 protein [Aulographum hederae CBS 113979]|uniref:Mannosyltransferase n=1 Tax=Aulographum hederae CBS 113979 TaxID=1176131 RepID=A0A6G1GTR1_9PEZI|nr:glycosyltransferase family 22 protein [Aulographum hederae CBS 113979]